jgi:hypothetical protein
VGGKNEGPDYSGPCETLIWITGLGRMDAQLLALRVVGVNRVGALDTDCGGRVADHLSCRSRGNYADDSAFGVVGVVGLTPLHHTAN